MLKKILNILIIFITIAFINSSFIYAEESNWAKLGAAISNPDSAVSVDGLFEVIDNSGTKTIKLLADITAETTDGALYVPGGKSLILDLNGHMLNRNRVNSNGDWINTNGGSAMKVDGNIDIISSNNDTQHVGYIKVRSDDYQVWFPGNAPNGEEELIINGGIICGGCGGSGNSGYKYAEGGAIYYNGTGTISNITICGNVSGYGAVTTYGNTFSAYNCSFKYNVVKYATSGGGKGGAIYVWATKGYQVINNIENCIFEHNSALNSQNLAGYVVGNGGAIFLEPQNKPTDYTINSQFVMNVKDCLFDSNMAVAGGAISLFNHVTCNVSGCTFRNNSATSGGLNGGGAIVNNRGILHIYDCIFDSNSANYGGAISEASSATSNTYIHSGEFTNNIANLGGSAICTNSSLQLIADEGKEIVITGNKCLASDGDNAAVFVQSGTGNGLSLSGQITIKDNDGGDLFITENASAIKVIGDLKDSEISISTTPKNSITDATTSQNSTPHAQPFTISDGVDKDKVAEVFYNPYMPGEFDIEHSQFLSGCEYDDDGQLENTVVYDDQEGKYVPNQDNPPTSYIQILESTGGSISINVTEALAGEIVTVTHHANDGYYFSKIEVKDDLGNSIPLHSNTSYIAPMRNVTVKGIFKIVPIEQEVIEEETQKELVKPKFVIKDIDVKQEDNSDEEVQPDILTNVTVKNIDIDKTLLNNNGLFAIKILNSDILDNYIGYLTHDLISYRNGGHLPIYIDELYENSVHDILDTRGKLEIIPYIILNKDMNSNPTNEDSMDHFVDTITSMVDGKSELYFELGINLYANGELVGSINELPEPLDFEITVDEKIAKDRYVYIFTKHKGSFTYNLLELDDDKVGIYSSSLFSPFRLVSTRSLIKEHSSLQSISIIVLIICLLFIAALIIIKKIWTRKTLKI